LSGALAAGILPVESAYHWEEIDMSCRRLVFVGVSATLIFGCLSLTGCVTSKAVLTNNYSPTNHYEKVYMVAMDSAHDPRGVQPKVAEKLRAMGLEVELVDPENAKDRQGSGFIVTEQGHILTCAHAVGSEKEATIWLGGERIYADVVQVDTNDDIALLKPQTELTNQVQRLWIIGDAKVTMGQDVFTIGFPLTDILGKSARLTKGLVSATVGVQDDPKQLQVSAEVNRATAAARCWMKTAK
jgi:serine protease Do